MKFCFKCRQKLSGDEKFCPNCGQKLPLPPKTEPAQNTPAQAEPMQNGPAQNVPAQPVPVQEHRKPKRDCSRHGIIFTDLKALSSFMRCNHDDLRTLFEKYAEFMADSDIDYKLVDVSDYKFR